MFVDRSQHTLPFISKIVQSYSMLGSMKPQEFERVGRDGDYDV